MDKEGAEAVVAAAEAAAVLAGAPAIALAGVAAMDVA